MTESITLMGVVLSAAPVGEFDKRLVILTKERGKITAFARGARKQNSPLLAVSNPFVFGSFTLYQGKNSYSLMQASVVHHFRELAAIQPQVYYGFYFLEFAEFYSSENTNEQELVNLIFVALKALQNEKLEQELVRYIFEIRIMAINGEFGLEEGYPYEESTRYAIHYVMTAEVQKLFTFTVTPQVLQQIRHAATFMKERIVDRKFKSFEILQMML